MTTLFASLEIAERFQCLTTAHILHKIAYDIKCARETGRNLIEGRYWTRYPIEALCAAFPWLSERTIKTKVESLIEAKILIVGFYNEIPFDRRRWFAFDNEEDMMLQLFGVVRKHVEKPAPGTNRQNLPNQKMQNLHDQNVQNLPDDLTGDQERSKKKKKKKQKELKPPVLTEQEIAPYRPVAAEWEKWVQKEHPDLVDEVKFYAEFIGEVGKVRKHSPQRLMDALQYIKESWWKDVAINPASLLSRSKSSKLMWIDTILKQSDASARSLRKPAQKREKASTYQSNDNSGFENEATF